MSVFGTPISVPLLARKSISVDALGGDISSDAGLIPLALADRRLGLTAQLAQAIADPRDARRLDHTLHDQRRHHRFAVTERP